MAARSLEDAATALTARVEARRVAALAALPAEQQARLGQFFTPERAAELIADMPRLPESVDAVRVLDPGAGVGSLAAAFVARAIREHAQFRIEIVAVEVDKAVATYLALTLDDLTATAAHEGLEVMTSLVLGDFVELSTSTPERPVPLGEPFDIVIMNPPYHKLGLRSWYRQAMLTQGVECSNIYAAFLALGALALREGGQLVAITPRSFANGPYFGQFRRFLLDRVVLDRLHVFESRSTVFSDTGVLQENVVFSATHSRQATEVVLSVSRGHVDALVERVVAHADVVHPEDTQQFIRILAADTDMAVAEQVAAQPAQLPDLNVNVSTGKVVDFRARQHLRPHPNAGSVPLIYPGNLTRGGIEWPRDIRKDQAFLVLSPADEKKYLLPEGYYVAVKRFSAKEERRRVVAAVWDPTVHPGPVAFENHLNVFHDGGQGLSRDIAIGLSYWLNSSLVDSFFRTFSGHTQVNATDLRALRFPTRTALETLGRQQDVGLPDQAKIDAAVETLLVLGSAAAA
jgi:adenine-specific DNA-methyltransferase